MRHATALATRARITLDELDAIVGGAAAVHKPSDDIADLVAVKPASPADEPLLHAAHPDPAQTAADQTVLGQARGCALIVVNEMFSNAIRDHGHVGNVDNYLGMAVNTLAASGVPADHAHAMLVALAYEMVEAKASLAGVHPYYKAAFEGLEGQLLAKYEELPRGAALVAGYGASLGDTLGRGMDVIAAIGRRTDADHLQDAISHARTQFENGLDLARHTRLGKALFDAFEHPANVEGWKNLIAEKAIGYMSPNIVVGTALGFACSLVESGALARVWGGSDLPGEMKQAAHAASALVTDLKDSFVEVYKTGFLGSIEKVGGMFLHAAQNLDALRRGVMSGDPAKMGRAIGALAADAVADLKDVVTNFYVTAPTMVFNLGCKTVMNLLDNLGATKYAEIAVGACREALTSFAADARAGIVGAASVLGDFAQRGLSAAIGVLSDIARGPGLAAEAAARALGKAAHAVDDAAKLALHELADLAYTQPLKIARAAAEGLAEAGKAAGAIATEAVTILRGVAAMPGDLAKAAVAGLGDIAKAGIGACAEAVDKLGHIGREAGEAVARLAVRTLGEVADLAGSTAGAALDGLKSIGGAVGHAGEDAVKELSRIARSIGNSVVAQQAIKDLEHLGNDIAHNGEIAVNELRSLGESGLGAARDAINRLADAGNSFARGVKDFFDKLNPAHWFHF